MPRTIGSIQASTYEGVMNGAFLMGCALAWPAFAFGPRAATATRVLLLVGTWINWVGTELSAVMGTSRMTPIAGAGHAGPEWAERVVEICLIATLPTMVPAVGLMIWGAWRAAPSVTVGHEDDARWTAEAGAR